MRTDGKSFVWYDSKGQGRNTHADFRKSFHLGSVPDKAEFNLFADTVYQLKVNGVFVGFGPVRFDPRFPQYDTYEIAKYLVNGENVISVTVNYFGMKTYKAIPNQAGMACWGSVSNGTDAVSLDSTSFKCMESPVFKHYMSKISFALNPGEIYDQRCEETGWTLPGYNDSHWKDAVILDDQDAWGELKPREMPFMRLTEINIEKDINAFPLVVDEEIHSFELPAPHFYEDNKEMQDFIAFKTWVWSPKKQSVSIGTFWAESWLNGNELPKGYQVKNRNMRINQIWELDEGWNFYMGKVGVYMDCLYQMYAAPKDAGLVFSADKKTDPEYTFAHSSFLTIEKYEETLKNKPLPYSFDDELTEAGGWTYVKKDHAVKNGVRWASWDHYGEQFEMISSKELKGKTFSKELYPDGFSILIDVDHTRLLLPKFTISGVAGATIDIAVSEYLLEDGMHTYSDFNYMGGDRVICKDDIVSYMPMQPRGFQFLMLTVRNTGGDVTINELAMLDAAYPGELKGEFQCSDPLLNGIWEICKTTQEVNMEDAYVDCVGRERGMYTRDTIIQYYNNLVSFGDHLLYKHCMELYGQSADPSGKYRAVYPNAGTYTIADFCLDALEGHLVYYRNTGDAEHVRTYWDAMAKNLGWFDQLSDEREDKLLDAEWNIHRNINANYGGFHGDLNGNALKTGIHCLFSCTYLYAINCMIELTEAIGKKQEAQKYKARAEKLRKSISEKLFDPKAGAFKDNLDCNVHSLQANLYAIRCGAVTQEQMPKVKRHIRKYLKGMFVNGYGPEKGFRFSPSYAFYMLDALYMADLSDIAEEVIKTGWGWYLHKGLPTTAEYFVLYGGDSRCHAWSASPMYYLSKNISGIHFVNAPDLSKIKIDVKTANVEWAKVKYPHPNGGIIHVEWHMEKSIRVFDVIEVPEGVEFEIV